MADWNMQDIKIITVVLGSGGKLAATFDISNGELRLYPNEQVDKAPSYATLYESILECIQWSIAELENVKRDRES